jgi:hypothetical protein
VAQAIQIPHLDAHALQRREQGVLAIRLEKEHVDLVPQKDELLKQGHQKGLDTTDVEVLIDHGDLHRRASLA